MYTLLKWSSTEVFSLAFACLCSLEASFHYSDDINSFTLSDEDQALHNEAEKCFKSKMGRDTESTLRKMRDERFREPWLHDLLYDR